MQAGGADSTAVSEAPSSGSEDSDCEQGPETDADAALTEEWARELLAGAGVVDPHEVCLVYVYYLLHFRTLKYLFI